MTRVGVYVDGYNLYYGARRRCGRSTPGWRWLDLRAMSTAIVSSQSTWVSPTIEHLVYCTARISGASNSEGQREQDVYLRALERSGNVDLIAYGKYVNRVTKAPLATPAKNGRPELTRSDWPVMVRDVNDEDVPEATFMVSIARREEKGSDVNVASHLLIDALGGAIDAAVVISNDSDLAFPIRHVREQIPVGLVNPTPGYLAGDLQGSPTDGVGDHWWYQLTAQDLERHQLPPTINGKIRKPPPW